VVVKTPLTKKRKGVWEKFWWGGQTKKLEYVYSHLTKGAVNKRGNFSEKGGRTDLQTVTKQEGRKARRWSGPEEGHAWVESKKKNQGICEKTCIRGSCRLGKPIRKGKKKGEKTK